MPVQASPVMAKWAMRPVRISARQTAESRKPSPRSIAFGVLSPSLETIGQDLKTGWIELQLVLRSVRAWKRSGRPNILNPK